MSVRSYISLFLALLLMACQVPTPSLPSIPTLASHREQKPPTEPTAEASPQAMPCCQIRLHPEEKLYVGDQVSFEIIAPSAEPYLSQTVTVTLSSPSTLIGNAPFKPYGFDRRPQATLLWAWDTQSLAAGEYQLHFSIPALQEEWTQTVTLLPRASLPVAEQTAQWQSLNTDCCEIYFITQTAAQRDIEEIAEIVTQRYQTMQAQIPIHPEQPLSVVLIPRVIGNGGFANAEINVSYLDRNYTSSDFATILHHEMAHLFDQLAQPDGRPSLYVEGIAVYLSGGHYYPEPLLPRAAELVRSQKYIPLPELATDFYAAQHEIAYLEAGALVEYMSHRWGWQKVWETYLAMSLRKGETQLQAIERALQTELGLSLETLEKDFLTALTNTNTTLVTSLDIANMEHFYEVMRAYQQQLDPSAYYRTAWMLDGEQMRHRRITADYLRHPSQIENLVLELLLNEAGRARRAGEFGRAEAIIEAVESALAGLPRKNGEYFSYHPIARDAWDVVSVLLALGYEPQMWTLGNDRAEVLVTQGSTTLKQVILERHTDGWQILSGASATADDLIERTQ
ncbi:MAG: hypothetical protein Kow0088_23380 [Anaerolineales bacterium]